MVCIELTKVLKNYVKHCSDYERTLENIPSLIQIGNQLSCFWFLTSIPFWGSFLVTRLVAHTRQNKSTSNKIQLKDKKIPQKYFLKWIEAKIIIKQQQHYDVTPHVVWPGCFRPLIFKMTSLLNHRV